MNIQEVRVLDHSGGDIRLLKKLLGKDIEHELAQMAGSRAGAMSIGIIIAANMSIAHKKTINIKDMYDFI